MKNPFTILLKLCLRQTLTIPIAVTLFTFAVLLTGCSTSPQNNDKPFKPHYNGTWYVTSPTYAQYVGTNQTKALSASISARAGAQAQSTGIDTIVIHKGDKYNLHLNADTLEVKERSNQVMLIFDVTEIRSKYFDNYTDFNDINFQWMLDSDSPYYISEAGGSSKDNYWRNHVDITHRCNKTSTKIDTIKYLVKPKEDSLAAVILVPVEGLTKTINEMTDC
jgi:hypothetical protein